MRALLSAALAIGVAIGLTSCAAPQTVIAPDGYPATHIRCNGDRMDSCHARAQRVCPTGYLLLHQSYGSIVIRCR